MEKMSTNNTEFKDFISGYSIEVVPNSAAKIESFAEIIYRAGYASPIRTPRGEDIMAACGQLKSATEKERKSKRISVPVDLNG